jgi:hypothetical protein
MLEIVGTSFLLPGFIISSSDIITALTRDIYWEEDTFIEAFLYPAASA